MEHKKEIKLEDALARTIIQLGMLNIRYCDDDPRTVRDLETIENWMNMNKEKLNDSSK